MNFRPFSRPLPLAVSAAALLFSSAPLHAIEEPPAKAADGPVAAIQDSLRRQQYYSGEVTGKFDEATKGAVRRFQIRQGLKVTGDLDAETLESLAKAERTTGSEAPAPIAEQVPARERARHVVQDDRQFLEQIETSDEPVTSSAPPAPARESAPPEPRVTRPPAPQAEAPVERQAAPPPPERRERREEIDIRPPAPRESRSISGEEARRFVESYLGAAERPSPDREISFYGDRVDYFGDGKVSKESIQRDQRAYYKRWPERQFELTDDPEVVRASGDEATIRFRIKYHVSNGDDSARGRTENVLRIRRVEDGLKIVAIRERKLD